MENNGENKNNELYVIFSSISRIIGARSLVAGKQFELQKFIKYDHGK